MQRQLKAAIVVEGIVFALAFALSIFYFAAGGNKGGHFIDAALIIAWVLVAVLLLLVFRTRSLVREEMVRRFYFSADWVYNHEIGYAPLSRVIPDRDPYAFVTFAADSLAKMSYGFEIAQAPENFRPQYLISSSNFQYHLIGDEEFPEESSAVIDDWEGSLAKVTLDSAGKHSYEEIGTYANAKELARLIELTGVFEGAAIPDTADATR